MRKKGNSELQWHGLTVDCYRFKNKSVISSLVVCKIQSGMQRGIACRRNLSFSEPIAAVAANRLTTEWSRVSIYNYQLMKSVCMSERCALRLLPKFSSQSLRREQIILQKGEVPAYWVHVVAGLVGAMVPQSNKGHSPVSVYGEGSWLGEVSLMEATPSVLEYVCLSDVRIVLLPLSEVQEVFASEPEFSTHMLKVMAWRIQHQTEMLAHLRSSGPQLRVVMGLALFVEVLRKSASHMPVDKVDGEFDIQLTQTLLATMCGVSRGVFSECAKSLEADGWLMVNYSSLRVLQMQRWASFSQFHRSNRFYQTNPSIFEILSLMREAA